MAEGAGSLLGLARRWLTRGAVTGRGVALVAESLSRLREIIGEASAAVEAGRALNAEGIFYAGAGTAPAGKVAFVYPGSGMQFAGMGRELAARFPEILRRQDAENLRLAAQFGGARFWSGEAIESVSTRDAIFAQVSMGAFVTDLLGAFGVRPEAVIGYSLGESTGLFATRAWRGRDEMLARMHASTLFTSDLTGVCDAARRAWKLAADEKLDWVVGVINRSGDVVRREIVGRERVYLLIVNSPGECVIGGDRMAVEKLVRDVSGAFHAVRGVTTVHCDVAKEVEGAYRELHLLETTPPTGVKFYSSALGAAYAVTREAAAESIVRQAVGAFDFTKVIEAAYADGVRIFVEVGPGGSCTRMIGQILEGREHIARAVCVAGAEDVGMLLRVLGQSIAAGVAVDLGFLYGDAPAAKVVASGRVITVRTGGEAFVVPAPSKPAAREWVRTATDAGAMDLQPLIAQMTAAQMAHAEAQETFLRVAEKNTRALGEALAFQLSLLAGGGAELSAGTAVMERPEVTEAAPALDRALCLEFAVGKVGDVLGNAFAHVDAYPTRVRLPDEPLMLVDRIVSIEAEANGLLRREDAGGRVITEHDVLADAWYLDANKIPTCIAVEAGQADLFLSGYLGIDSITRGRAVYRLLDAVVTFHGPLPGPGETIVYDIAIEHFFRQGATHLFRFHFEATVRGQRFLSMTKGCAGFFTEGELAAGQGIVLTAMDKRSMAGKRAGDWRELVPMEVESYSDTQITALRRGDLAECFGERFSGLAVEHVSTIPAGRMTLVHRILALDPRAGRYGLGQIVGEADIRADDWFLTCHFVDDRVMPGTLMYECCLHTLRVYLMRMGWVGEAGEVAYEPVAEIASQLKCRGQVTAATKKVRYEVTLKEAGYLGDGTPYVVADALMYGDGKAIVQMTNMSVRLTGMTRAGVEGLWAGRISDLNKKISDGPLFDTDQITAFALGKPSEAFGERYRIFDPGEARKIARLPGPPYQFLDRIVKIENCEAFKLAAGGVIEAQYDVPRDTWYFAANQQKLRSEMPFSILLEVALQPCGWLAAYLGSALVSDVDMRFRNLGGSAVQLLPVLPDCGVLATTVKITNVSNSGGMLIQHFDMAVRSRAGEVYRGNTYFGFFSKEALANQVGIRDAAIYVPTAAEMARAERFSYPTVAPFADRQMRMVEEVEHFDAAGGSKGLGFIRGTTAVNPDAWFFKAHFFEDPVWPGSLGLESFIQLLKVVAYRRWGADMPAERVQFQALARGQKHSWIYRGQILPTDSKVKVEAVVTEVDDARRLIRADSFLTVDNRVIYQMKDFAIMLTADGR